MRFAKIMSKKRFLFGFFVLIIQFSIGLYTFTYSAFLERSYKGPPLSRPETAILYLNDVQILSINDVVKNYWGVPCEFLPGSYTLVVRYLVISPTKSSTPVKIKFNALKGHNYVLSGSIAKKKGNDSSKRYFTPFIEDITTGQLDHGTSAFSQKRRDWFNKKITKRKEKNVKAYKKFLKKLDAFEPIRLSFYEYDGTAIPKGIRANTRFKLSATRYIIAELKVKNLKREIKEQRFKLRWRYYFPKQMTMDGKWKNAFEVCDFTSEMLMTSEQTFSLPWVSWGSKTNEWIFEKGKGIKGTYIVAVYLNNREIFEDRFVMH